MSAPIPAKVLKKLGKAKPKPLGKGAWIKT